MRVLLGSIVLATLLVSCFSICIPGLQGRPDWYQCEGLSDLTLPAGAAGINIVNSNISKIPTDAFAELGDTLTELNITGCGLEDIEPDAFRGLYKLQLLSLVGNNILKIDASWIRGLSGLRVLNLWRNQIIDIDPEMYDMLPKLDTWDLSQNDLSVCLSPRSLMKLRKLRLIYLTQNPWFYRCRASMTWYLDRNQIRAIRDWGVIGDSLIEECLAHEQGAESNDAVLKRCVDRKELVALPVALEHLFRELMRRVSNLEADVAMLKAPAP